MAGATQLPGISARAQRAYTLGPPRCRWLSGNWNQGGDATVKTAGEQQGEPLSLGARILPTSPPWTPAPELGGDKHSLLRPRSPGCFVPGSPGPTRRPQCRCPAVLTTRALQSCWTKSNEPLQPGRLQGCGRGPALGKGAQQEIWVPWSRHSRVTAAATAGSLSETLPVFLLACCTTVPGLGRAVAQHNNDPGFCTKHGTNKT
ncbi:PREDICTED: uncharacterized protein LOC102026532 [Chinchilla lanigera]|uniref:uncharacterized protein LOC102026532 n=1 Tax=Chinchilla lanigera TaxID=34839 RepID=UPI00038EEDDD|nr:PREDICTED: uncharacterized protein LOC102026532 [Chinchilla lanigera]